MPDSGLINNIRCAAINNGTLTRIGCSKQGLQYCSKCRLVKYCSKECQKTHWARHRHDCNDPYLKPTWQPGWIAHKRTPAFITKEGQEPYVIFGHQGRYLWGNVPAIDFLNLANNEGETAQKLDLNLCFAASGDIRNMVVTVNGLPSDYSGKCSILLNDRDPAVVGRNLLLLHALTRDKSEIEETAEFAVHLLYSAALTAAQSVYFEICVNTVFGDSTWRTDPSGVFVGRLDTRGAGQLYTAQRAADVKVFDEMVHSSYTISVAQKNREDVMCASSRSDYVDRYLSNITPSHRLSFIRARRTGIVLPFGVPTDQFTQPNRALFSKDGKWMTMDSACPLFGWDARAVLDSGKRHGCSEEDVFGCLFFHVKDQFMEFERRLRDFHIDIHTTNMDASLLAQAVKQGAIPSFHPKAFDRVETSNIADYVSVGALIESWGPLLNRKNKHAALLLTFMNWMPRVEGGSVESLQPDAVAEILERAMIFQELDRTTFAVRSLHDSSLVTKILGKLDPFYDNDAAFVAYLNRKHLNKLANSQGLKVRIPNGNTIVPKRIGFPLDGSSSPAKLPPFSKKEFYLLVDLACGTCTERFVELHVSDEIGKAQDGGVQAYSSSELSRQSC